MSNRTLNQEIASLIINYVLPIRNKGLKIPSETLGLIAIMKQADLITAQIAKEMIGEIAEGKEKSEDIIARILLENSSSSDLSPKEIARKVVNTESSAVSDYKNGKKAAMSHLMGVAMKLAGKSVNGKILKEEMEKEIGRTTT